MGLRIQVPGLSYFSIDLVQELRRHTLCGSGSGFARRVAHLFFFSPAAMPAVPKSDRRPVWRRRRFFISSVEDSVLERRAALESLCFGIGFGRLELTFTYTFFITVLCFFYSIIYLYMFAI